MMNKKFLVFLLLLGLLIQTVVFADVIRPALDVTPGVIGVVLVCICIIIVSCVSILMIKKGRRKTESTENNEKQIKKNNRIAKN